MFDVEGARKAGYSDAEIADHMAGQKFDTKAAREAGYSDADIVAHLMPKKDEPGMLKSLGAGLGKGVGTVALGAQRLVGKGLQAISTEESQGNKAGQWLVNDADQGRSKLAAENAPYAEANPITNATGVLGGEIAATLPVGAGLAAPLSKVAPNLASAVATGGMRGGNMATRMFGGGITAGASAAMVDSESAGAGAAIGAATPGVLKIAGKAGGKLADLVRGPVQSADLAAAVKAARAQGYVIPPTQANASLLNRLTEGFSGKLTTAQNASAKNSVVTSDLAAKSLGLPSGTKITPDVLNDIREKAGRAYADLGGTGMVTPGQAYGDALDKIVQPFKLTAGAFPGAKASPVIDLVESLRSPAFASASAVEKIKQLRTAADDAFRTGNTDVGRAARGGAKALEDAIEEHLKVIGEPEKLAAFREARKTIAKTYTVQKALNPETGTVDARKLADELKRGKPLSGELEAAARFASRFKTANQVPEQMGSLPQSSPLDWNVAALASFATGNPLPMAGVLARPSSRGYTLSDFAQNRLIQKPGIPLSSLGAERLIYRGAPLLAAEGQ